MSYHVYTTDGIIIKRTPFGEANILLHILTNDLGLIIASARSARLSVSKLRSALQEGSVASISCVKGKGGWKITNAVYKHSIFFDYPPHTHKTISNVFSVLLKMIVGEIPDAKTFSVVSNGFMYLKNIAKEECINFEILMLLRILNRLGYIAKDDHVNMFLDELEKWDDDILKNISDNKTNLVAIINKALRESQL